MVSPGLVAHSAIRVASIFDGQRLPKSSKPFFLNNRLRDDHEALFHNCCGPHVIAIPAGAGVTSPSSYLEHSSGRWFDPIPASRFEGPPSSVIQLRKTVGSWSRCFARGTVSELVFESDLHLAHPGACGADLAEAGPRRLYIDNADVAESC